MKIENRTPLQAPKPDQGPIAGNQPKLGGRTFTAAFTKALIASPSATARVPVSAPVALPGPAAALTTALAFPNVSGPVAESGISPEDHMETIKFRMKTGYYNDISVGDAISEKLSAIFDDQA